MKKILFILLFSAITLSCSAKIITGEVEYNVEGARTAAFSSPNTIIDFNSIKNKLIDSNFAENANAISAGIQELQNRRVVGFSDGSYGITYYDDPLYSWFYYQGKLINFTQKSSEYYPCKITKYKPDGSIANTGYKVSDSESFIFSTDGKLIAHWKNNLCFDGKNNIIMKRKNL